MANMQNHSNVYKSEKKTVHAEPFHTHRVGFWLLTVDDFAEGPAFLYLLSKTRYMCVRSLVALNRAQQCASFVTRHIVPHSFTIIIQHRAFDDPKENQVLENHAGTRYLFYLFMLYIGFHAFILKLCSQSCDADADRSLSFLTS